jgi:hypothetical protein
MKKTIFTPLVVLLTMLAVTCDSALVPQKVSSEAVPAADSNVVTVGINIADDRARALTKAYSQTVVEGSDGFYEVVFVSTGTNAMTVRDNADRAKFDLGWKVTVPRAQYTTANTTDKAVLFVGKKSDKTLLAIGALTIAADFLTPGSEPTDITFALTSITSELNILPASSSFTIPGLTGYSVLATTDTIDGVTNPLKHRIPKDTTVTGASYAFAGLPANIVFLANSGYQFVSAASIDPGVSLDMGTITAPGSFLTANQAIVFTFDTADTLGFAKIYVEVPVFAVNSTKHDDYGKPEAILWYVRGGVDNKTIDSGDAASAANTGGAVLIELYDPKVVDGVDVNTPNWS